MSQELIINAPSPEVLAELLRLAEETGRGDGPVFAHDRERQVFVTLVLAAGRVVHWQVEPAPTVEHAERLQQRHQATLQLMQAIAQSTAETLEAVARATEVRPLH